MITSHHLTPITEHMPIIELGRRRRTRPTHNTSLNQHGESMQYAAQDVVKSMSLGSRTAEEEKDALSEYFVETESWRKVYEDEADLIYAPKGGGKSAIYAMLREREGDLFDRKILLISAENPSGKAALQGVRHNPPTPEHDFLRIWKLYFISLVAKTIEEYGIKNDAAKTLLSKLTKEGLHTPQKRSITQLLRDVVDYTKRSFSLTASMPIAPEAGASTPTFTIAFSEPSLADRQRGMIGVDSLFELCDEAFALDDLKIWILIDRLDVAFADSPELERNALRALFRVYNDMQAYSNISLKIFLRSDIWNAINVGGFREASHLTRSLNISWTPDSLLQLAIQRILRSDILCEYYKIDRNEILSNSSMQKEIFHKVYPPQIDQGARKPKTFDWCLSRTKDGTENNAPRELIHLLATVKVKQLDRCANGNDNPVGESIYDRQSFKDAMKTVSEVRLQQTLYAEYPSHRENIEKLRGQKATQSLITLSEIWELPLEECSMHADALVAIGFFEKAGDFYNVPFMYRPFLKMTQGKAKSSKEE